MRGSGARTTRLWRGLGAAAALMAIMALTGCTPRWQSELASVNGAGTDSGDGASWGPKLSPDGTKVVFESRASNLGPTDTNGATDVYVRDLTSGETQLVSVNAAGTDSGNADSNFPWFSPDGSKVLFASRASNLTSPGTGGQHFDLYVRDLARGTTTLVSVNADGTGGGDGNTTTGAVSPVGNKVVFASDARNLVPPGPGEPNGIFERDLTSGVTSRLADGLSPVYSPSGDAIAFMRDGNVWLRNSATGAVTKVSPDLPVGSDGGTYDGPIVFSHDGTKLAFERDRRTNFVQTDIYVHDRVSRRTILATVAAGGSGGSNNTPTHVHGFDPANSNRLLFSSRASNLVTNDRNGSTEDVFVRNLSAGATRLVTVTSGGTASGPGHSGEASWVGDGTKIAFLSWGNQFGATDTNTAVDVYVRDETAGTYRLVSANAAGDDAGDGPSGEYDMIPVMGIILDELSVSSDGSRVAFGSDATNLGPTDSDRSDDHDIYVASLVTPP